MAISNEDISAWFRLDKVEVKVTPPSKPCSSATRAALAKQERERRLKEEQEDISYYEKLKQIMLNKIESSDEEFDHDQDDDFDLGEGRILNLVAQTDQTECVIPTHTSVFDPYNFDYNDNPVLPILDHKEHIISTIESNSVTVIQGSTGSGKSTQVPQYILEKYARERRYCNIICTQPRRIAAVSVAKYVAEKRGWRVGTLVGYQIAMDKLISEDTRLTFVTTGVLLQKLIKMQNMNQYTHVILDEVHERDKDTDFCLLLVRTFLRSNSRNVKVILMSATLESKTFAGYFSETIRIPSQVRKIKVPAPILNIDAEPHEVIEYFLESIFALEGIDRCDLPSENDPRIDRSMYQLACRLVTYFDKLEHEDKKTERGTVLVFLPGMPEIQSMDDVLKRSEIANLTIVPLHSSISNTEQHRVFLKPDKGRRKIILATNIAESSITVPDIKYVIDFCLVKELVLDKLTNFQSLKLQWASKASLTQRKGRAGRVSEGRCFRLITEQFYVGLYNFSEPEIKRVPIESLVLYAKQMNVGTPTQVLSRALEPPDPDGIAKAVINLKEVGALTVTMNGKPDPHDGDLTRFGEILASLPVDVKVGKLLILGHVFGLLEECLIIAASLSLKPMFVQLYHDEGMISYKSKMSWADYSFSDCITMLNAYREWLNRKNSGQFRGSERLEREWCERNFIKKNVIRETSELVVELANRLRSFNITTVKQYGNKYNKKDNRNQLVLKLVIAGAFYPYYFRWGVADEEQANREMSGHNPLTTVMISGLPTNPIRYHHKISALFNDCGEGKSIHFESSRAYLEFERPLEARRQGYVNTVLDAVYIALKKRHARNPLCIEITNDPNNGGDVSAASSFKGEHDDLLPTRLPKKGFHSVVVTEVVTPDHFWVQYCNEDSQKDVRDLAESIRLTTLCPMASKLPLSAISGQYCLAMYSVDRTYYRGLVKSVNQTIANVLFVDYGNEEHIPLEFVCILPPHLREKNKQAFECYLMGVKPLTSRTGQSRWTRQDTEQFKQMVMGKEMYLRVYSEVHGMLRVELWDTNMPEMDINIREFLIQKGIALACEESMQSKQAHDQLEKYVAPQKESRLLKKQSKSVDWRNPSRNPACQRRGEKCILKGPINPYEVSFQSITRSGGMRTTKIESDSVNSIVVDNEPNDSHERLMVAAQVNLSSSGNVLLARNTTLLPNIHGLAHLICLIFAPCVELRTDELKRQYTGALCGLGFCPNSGVSLFPDHDIELVFDCLITQLDIDQVNSVRHAINLTLSSESEWGKQAMRKIQEKARERLLDVILKSRDDIVPVPFVTGGWNQVPPEDIVPPKYCPSDDEYPPLLPLLNGVVISQEVIKPSKPAERVLLLKRVEALERNAVKSQESQTLYCNLCCIYLGSPNDLLLHLATSGHQNLKRKLKEELSSEDVLVEAAPLASSPSSWRSVD